MEDTPSSDLYPDLYPDLRLPDAPTHMAVLPHLMMSVCDTMEVMDPSLAKNAIRWTTWDLLLPSCIPLSRFS